MNKKHSNSHLVKISNLVPLTTIALALVVLGGCQSSPSIERETVAPSEVDKTEQTQPLAYKENSSEIVETSGPAEKERVNENSVEVNTLEESPNQEATINKYGIKIESLRLTAGGYLIDFRYRVIDPDKAKFLLDKSNKPLLTDPVSKFKATVPVPAKVGALRSSGKLIKDRVYFMLFANPAQYLKPGTKVTIEYGELKVENVPLLSGR